MARTHTSLQQPTASVLNNKNFTYNNYLFEASHDELHVITSDEGLKETKHETATLGL